MLGIFNAERFTKKRENGDIFLVVNRWGADDFDYVLTEDIKDQNEGCSTRGTRADILEGIKDLVKDKVVSLDEAVRLLYGQLGKGDIAHFEKL